MATTGISISQVDGAVLQILGPFAIAWDTPGIGSSEDGALLVELPAGATVLQHMIRPTTQWDGGDGTGVQIYLGGEDYAAPDDDFGPLNTAYTIADSDLTPSSGAGYVLGDAKAVFGQLSTAGALVAQCAGTFTSGAAEVSAVVILP